MWERTAGLPENLFCPVQRRKQIGTSSLSEETAKRLSHSFQMPSNSRGNNPAAMAFDQRSWRSASFLPVFPE